MTVRGCPVYPNHFGRVNMAPEKISQEAQLLPKPGFSSVLPAGNAGMRGAGRGKTGPIRAKPGPAGEELSFFPFWPGFALFCLGSAPLALYFMVNSRLSINLVVPTRAAISATIRGWATVSVSNESGSAITT